VLCYNFFYGKCRYITSDCDAVAVMFEDHKYAKAPEDAVADVIKAGQFVAWCKGKTHVQPVCIRNLMLVLEALSLPNLTGINMTYYCEYLHFQALMLINSR